MSKDAVTNVDRKRFEKQELQIDTNKYLLRVAVVAFLQKKISGRWLRIWLAFWSLSKSIRFAGQCSGDIPYWEEAYPWWSLDKHSYQAIAPWDWLGESQEPGFINGFLSVPVITAVPAGGTGDCISRLRSTLTAPLHHEGSAVDPPCRAVCVPHPAPPRSAFRLYHLRSLDRHLTFRLGWARASDTFVQETSLKSGDANDLVILLKRLLLFRASRDYGRLGWFSSLDPVDHWFCCVGFEVDGLSSCHYGFVEIWLAVTALDV